MMNNSRQIAPVIVDDSQLETEFTCLVECGEWRIEIKFRFHVTARCVRVTVRQDGTERCVNLRADCEPGQQFQIPDYVRSKTLIPRSSHIMVKPETP